MDFQTLISAIGQGQVKGITSDSRRVDTDYIFVALRGTQTDGHNYIEQAVAAGARFVVCEKAQSVKGADFVVVPDSSAVIGPLCQLFAGSPAEKLTNLAVTGTNGKTTTCFLVRQIINHAQKKCGLIGTIVYDNASGMGLTASDMTTPDPARLAQLTSEMVENGAQYMAIEASSHALEQNRLTGISFKAAAFTNLTGDHLDYHKTMDNYLNSKAKLFEYLASDSFAILNAQSDQSEILARRTQAQVLRYGIDCDADINAQILEIGPGGTQYNLSWQGNTALVTTTMPGKHNVSNQLAAAGLCLCAGLSLDTVAAGICSMKNVPGRLERIDHGQNFGVFVDYAHTDDALDNVLSTLRGICPGRLIVMFGCGGDRDKTKRPRMAQVCANLADIVIVTSDNPRTEDPSAIIDDIMVGFTKADMRKVTIEPDRETAIGIAIKLARHDDIVLLAGKGHEDYQIIGKQKIHFDDREVAREYLRSL